VPGRTSRSVKPRSPSGARQERAGLTDRRGPDPNAGILPKSILGQLGALERPPAALQAQGINRIASALFRELSAGHSDYPPAIAAPMPARSLNRVPRTIRSETCDNRLAQLLNC
jgi:hypothetical protein